MTPNDHQRFAVLLNGVHSFYGQDITDFAIGVWVRSLEPYAIEAIERAFDAHARDPKAGAFMPKPADLIRLLDGTHEDRAGMAWSKVYRAISTVGGYATVAFDDPAIHSAIADIGGWPAVCSGTVDELPFLQRRFCMAYTSHAKAKSPHPPKLLGRHDMTNAIGGHGAQKPVLIGNEVAAMAVISSGSDELPQLPGSAMRHIGAAIRALGHSS